MPDWIYKLPSWQLLLLFSGVSVGICWILIPFVRPPMRKLFGDDHEGRNRLIEVTGAGTGVIYGLLIGLIAVGAYDNYTKADDAVTAEANAVGVLYRDASNFPEPLRSELRTNIVRYINIIVDQEFPSAHRGKVVAAGTPIATQIQQEIASFDPTKLGGEALDGETFRQYGEFINDRNSRLNQMSLGLPSTLWFVLIAGAIINLILIAMLDVEKIGALLALSGVFAVFLGLMLFLVADLDHPFLGKYSISPEPFETIRDVVLPQIH